MNRNFEDRKSIKSHIKSKENKSIIKALDMYGRVPEQWELLEEIERLNNVIKDIKSQLEYIETYSSKEDVFEDMKRRLDRIESIVNRK